MPGRSLPFIINCLAESLRPEDTKFVQHMHRHVLHTLKSSAQRGKGRKVEEPSWDAQAEVSRLAELCKIG